MAKSIAYISECAGSTTILCSDAKILPENYSSIKFDYEIKLKQKVYLCIFLEIWL